MNENKRYEDMKAWEAFYGIWWDEKKYWERYYYNKVRAKRLNRLQEAGYRGTVTVRVKNEILYYRVSETTTEYGFCTPYCSATDTKRENGIMKLYRELVLGKGAEEPHTFPFMKPKSLCKAS